MCKIKKIDNKQRQLKKAQKSAEFLLGLIETTDLSKYVYREDYIGLKKIKAAIENKMKGEK